MKQCSKCKEWKDEAEFCKLRRSKDGLNCWCRLCDSKKRCKQTVVNKEKNGVNPPNIKNKRCPKCGEIKPASSFARDPGRKDGLSGWCMGCTHKNSLRWNEENREHVNNYAREWCKKNINKARMVYSRYNMSPNGKARCARGRHRRRNFEKHLRNDLDVAKWHKIRYIEFKNRCWWCSKKFTKDDPATRHHLIAPGHQHPGGDGLTYENVVPVHRSCNSSIQDMLPVFTISFWIWLYSSEHTADEIRSEMKARLNQTTLDKFLL